MSSPQSEVDSEAIAVVLGVSDEAVQARLAAMDLSAAQRDRLRTVAGHVTANADRFTRILYERFRAEPALAGFLMSETHVESLRRTQCAYLAELVAAPIDRGYVLNRLRLGLVHHQVRLTPTWYLATYSHFLCDNVDVVFAAAASPEDGVEHMIVFLKTVLFDAGLALQAYGYSEERELWASHHEPSPPPAPTPVAAPRRPAAPTRAPEIARLHLDGDMVAMRSRYIGVTDDDRRALAALEPVIAQAAPAVMDDFYALFSQQPETADLVPPDVVERLKRQVSSYWHEVARADFSRPYAASRMRIGVVHERIGLPPHWYLAGVARQAAGFMRALRGDARALAAGIKALVKAVFFDMTFVIDAYMDARADALLRTEHYASHLVANMASAVAVLDAGGRVQSANKALLRLLSIEPALLYLMPAERAFQIPQLTAILDRSRRDPTARIADIVRLRAKTYRVTIMELAEGDARKGAQRVLVLDDVTEVIGLAEQVERSVSGFDAVIDATRAIIWEMECPTGTILSMSHTVLDVLGYRDVYFLGRSEEWTACIADADRAEFARACADLAPGARMEIEHRMRRADGPEIWVRSILVRRPQSGERPLIFGLTVDVTELREANRRRAEAVLHAQRMEIVGRLAGGLSHDFNNTLTVIAANLEMARFGIVDPRASDCVARALAAAEISAGLNRRLLSYTRRGQHGLRPTRVNERITELTRLLARALGDDVRLETDLAVDLWPTRVDPADLDSAILNLTINARDAMPSGGTVTLATRNVPAADPERGFVRIAVRDTGIGMAPDVLRRASEPFFSTKSSPTSTGLGLHSVRQFVEHLGGHVTIESSLGQGSLVALHLPRADAAAADAAVSTAEIPLGDGEVVLVVDDSDAVLRATAMLLEGLGYAAVTAGDGPQALARLEAGEPIDLVLADVVMPGGLSGHELARRIRARWPAVEVVLTSANHAELGEPAEGAWTIRKPYARARLAEVVRAALRGQSRGSARTSPAKT